MYTTKYNYLQIDLSEEEAEMVMNEIIFIVKFEVNNYRCVFDSLRFEYVNSDIGEFIPIKPNDLEKYGIDNRVLNDIEDDINKEIEHWFYENYEVDPDENIEYYLERKNKTF